MNSEDSHASVSSPLSSAAFSVTSDRETNFLLSVQFLLDLQPSVLNILRYFPILNTRLIILAIHSVCQKNAVYQVPHPQAVKEFIAHIIDQDIWDVRDSQTWGWLTPVKSELSFAEIISLVNPLQLMQALIDSDQALEATQILLKALAENTESLNNWIEYAAILNELFRKHAQYVFEHSSTQTLAQLFIALNQICLKLADPLPDEGAITLRKKLAQWRTRVVCHLLLNRSSDDLLQNAFAKHDSFPKNNDSSPMMLPENILKDDILPGKIVEQEESIFKILTDYYQIKTNKKIFIHTNAPHFSEQLIQAWLTSESSSHTNIEQLGMNAFYQTHSEKDYANSTALSIVLTFIYFAMGELTTVRDIVRLLETSPPTASWYGILVKDIASSITSLIRIEHNPYQVEPSDLETARALTESKAPHLARLLGYFNLGLHSCHLRQESSEQYSTEFERLSTEISPPLQPFFKMVGAWLSGLSLLTSSPQRAAHAARGWIQRYEHFDVFEKTSLPSNYHFPVWQLSQHLIALRIHWILKPNVSLIPVLQSLVRACEERQQWLLTLYGNLWIAEMLWHNRSTRSSAMQAFGHALRRSDQLRLNGVFYAFAPQLHPLREEAEKQNLWRHRLHRIHLPHQEADDYSQTQIHELSQREQEILKMIVQGLSNEEIAQFLDRSKGTVKLHVHNIYRKLGLKNRVEAVQRYTENAALHLVDLTK
ncbi:MAG: response regulator transcription factor [Pseudomonadota bacterium]